MMDDPSSQADLMKRAGNGDLAAVDELIRRQPSGDMDERDPASMSPHQERLWFIDEFERDNVYEGPPVYHNVPLALRIRGEIDCGRLERSLRALVFRHRVLASQVVRNGDRALVRLRTVCPLQLEQIDLRNGDGGIPFDAALERTIAAVDEPFDLEREFLLRTKLFQVGEADRILLIVTHHLLADRGSMEVLQAELLKIYNSAGGESLEPAQLQYQDFAAWQRALTDDQLQPLRYFWTKELEGKLTPVALPQDRPRPAVHTFTSGCLSFELGADLAAAVARFTKESGGDEFGVLLAAFKVLLHRYAQQENIVVGITDPGRHAAGAAGIVGPVANLLVLATEIPAETNFQTLTKRVCRRLASARKYRDLPFDRLVQELNPQKDMSRTALFDILFDYVDGGAEAARFGTATIERIGLATGFGKYDLNVNLRRCGERILGEVVFNRDFFDHATVQRMFGHFVVLLKAATQSPQQALASLPMLTETELERLRQEGDVPQNCDVAGDNLAVKFGAAASVRPDAVAVISPRGRDAGDAEVQLSYGVLNSRANQLARCLQAEGVGLGSRIGVCTPRSAEMIVAVLGVLKAGGTYVPLDPSYPSDRLRFMMKDAGVSVVLTAGESEIGGDAKILDLSELNDRLAGLSDTDPGVSIPADSPAYVIYTSGTTGRPKGTPISHRQVLRLFAATQHWFNFDDEDVWSLFHSLSFDFSVWEIWGALLYGGKLVVAPYYVTRSTDEFHRLVEAERITVLNQTPTAFGEFDRHDAEKEKPDLALRYVIFGGEALEFRRLAGWLDRHGDERPRLVNMYGITETTVHVTYHPIRRADLAGDRSVIGESIPDLQTRVLDRFMALQPFGLEGELYVGGAGVASHYLNRPDLTAERFVPDPFAAVPGGRLYKTGDLACRQADGALVYRGRCDSQVKLRGFRIELGEIEAAFNACAEVREGVVAAIAEGESEQRLAAYFVADSPVGESNGFKADLMDLPNGMAVRFVNRNETSFIYREIFEDRAYLQHGVELRAGDVVFDVGANIGLFTLFAAEAGATVYSFEPVPQIFERLQANISLYAADAQAFPCGLAADPGEAEFTFYPNVAMMSGRYADLDDERDLARSDLRRQIVAEQADLSPADIEALLDERLRGEPVSCQLRTVSEVIAEQGVERIDLLKIDVEKSERDVLAGIRAEDWPRIRQVVIEVQDRGGRLREIEDLLRDHGYEVVVEQESLMSATDVYNVYARRGGVDQAETRAVRREFGPRPVEEEARMEQWRALFEDGYGQAPVDVDPAFNTATWNSSFTGAAIPAAAMREWVEQTVNRLRRLRPRRVWEIGCGTGLLLVRVAPDCERYLGTDLSARALDNIRSLIGTDSSLGHVALQVRSAHDFAGIEPAFFDTIVLNSVTQYFPGPDYLLTVLDQAVEALAVGGTIFVGDVRNLRLLEAYHAGIARGQTNADPSPDALRRQAARKASEEEELTLDPAFFVALRRRYRRLQRVSVELKGGGEDNEMTRYRYDVSLHFDTPRESEVNTVRRDWSAGATALDGLEKLLREERPERMEVSRFVNPRVAAELALWSDDHPSGEAVDPEELVSLGERVGYRVFAELRAGGEPGEYDVVFARLDSAAAGGLDANHDGIPAAAMKPWSHYANQPLASGEADGPETRIREQLKARLPDYMIPAVLIRLERLPLTPSGKVDRRALPAPAEVELTPERKFVAPRDEFERALAEIWADVLGAARVGVNDNFFDLGGHSLMATRLVSRLEQELDVPVSLRCLFENPTVAALRRQLNGAGELASRPEKANADEPALKPDPERWGEPFPLSDIQQAYWMGRNRWFELGNVASHSYAEIEYDALDIDRYRAAWRRLIARHEMLRAIVLPSGEQQVLPPREYEIEIGDLRQCSPGKRDERLAELRERMAGQVMEADRWPLFEICLSRLPGDRVRAHFSFDALIADAWSLRVLFNELFALYLEPDRRLPELQVSFRDYVLHEEALRQTEVFRAAEQYWTKRLDSLPSGPDLPLAADSAALERPVFERSLFKLSPGQWGALKELAGRRGLTPSALLIAAFAETLAAWSRTPHFTLNLTLFNRRPAHPQINDIVGDFTSLNMLEIDGSPGSFAERADRVQRQLWQDLDHRGYGGVRVLRELARQRGQSGRAMMPVVFTSTLSIDPGGEESVSAREFGETVYAASQTPQIWLDHHVHEHRDGLTLVWDSVAGLFPEGMLADMFSAYEGLLNKLAASEAAWSDGALNLLPAAQQQRRDEVNATNGPVSPALLHTLFEERALRHPDWEAVITPSKSLTYGELLAVSRRLGRALIDCGAEPNTLAAVVLPKGWEQVAAVMGILFSGAAYLPIDPELPVQRRRYLLANGEVRIVLTSGDLAAEEGWPEGIEVLTVEQLAGDAPAEASEPTAPRQKSTDLAYVIYTSGSTGSPKGVMIDHRGSVNTIRDINDRFAVAEQERALALSSLSFDLSVYDVFGMLAAGGAIVMPAAEKAKDPGHWLELIEEFQVRIFNAVPLLAQVLTDHVAQRAGADIRSLRLFMLSGDWIPLKLPEAIREHCGTCDIFSLGGATEASIWSIYYPIGQVRPEWRSIPYGRPLANQSFHVLDAALCPRPVWAVGDLYIGGIGLAQGYWKDDDKTRAAFIKHPETGERLYRTGDLGRYLPDGDIEFLGRDDHQVKIHGHRIELGEIEAALGGHPDVKDAVVDVLGDGEARVLAAWVVARAEETAEFVVTEQQTRPDAGPEWDAVAGGGEAAAQQAPLTMDLDSVRLAREKLDQYAVRAMIQTLDALGVLGSDQPRSPAGIIAECGLRADYEKLLRQWLEVLSERGIVERAEAERYRCSPPAADVRCDSEALWEEIVTLLESHSWAQPVLEYVERTRRSHLGLWRGEENPLELLFPDGSWETAEGIYQENPLADYYNRIAGELMKGIAGVYGENETVRVLEVGAGTGGSTGAMLEALCDRPAEYLYTDRSTFFTDEARAKFSAYPFLEFGLYDIDQDPAQQGLAGRSFDVIVAANVLHDAHSISETLERLASLLEPNGWLLMVEGTRVDPLQLIGVGFLEGLSAFADERVSDGSALLSVDQWREQLRRSGFVASAAFPGEAVADHLQQVLVARGPAERRRFDADVLRHYLGERLPAYMVPASFNLLSALPLNANGKFDRKALPVQQAESTPATSVDDTAPRTATEQRLSTLFGEVLNREGVGVREDFFGVGGDSLLAIRLAARIREEFAVELALQRIFEEPRVESLAGEIDRLLDTNESPVEETEEVEF